MQNVKDSYNQKMEIKYKNKMGDPLQKVLVWSNGDQNTATANWLIIWQKALLPVNDEDNQARNENILGNISWGDKIGKNDEKSH